MLSIRQRKVCPCTSHEGMCRSGGIAKHILETDTLWRWMNKFIPAALPQRGNLLPPHSLGKGAWWTSDQVGMLCMRKKKIFSLVRVSVRYKIKFRGWLRIKKRLIRRPHSSSGGLGSEAKHFVSSSWFHKELSGKCAFRLGRRCESYCLMNCVNEFIPVLSKFLSDFF